MSEVVFIYTLADPRTNNVRYVGKTFNLAARLCDHCDCRTYTHKSNWIRQLKTEGVKPIIEVLESFVDAAPQEWMDAERFWIETLRFLGCKLTNLESGGKSGTKRSQETKDKIASKMIGRKISIEAREKLRIANTGRKMTEDQCARIKLAAQRRPRAFYERLAAKNRNPSSETLLKMSIASTGRPCSQQRAEKVALAIRGIKRSKETKEKMSASQKIRMASRKALGLKPSPEHHAKFIGGLTPEVIARRSESIRQFYTDRRNQAKT